MSKQEENKMEYKTQKEVIEKLKDDHSNTIECLDENIKEQVFTSLCKLGLAMPSSISTGLYIFLNKYSGEIDASLDKDNVLCTGEEFLKLPYNIATGSADKETMDFFGGEEATSKRLPRVITEAEIKSEKEWKAFEDIHNDIASRAMDMKSNELKKFVKVLKGIK